jgi:hypothetical protein
MARGLLHQNSVNVLFTHSVLKVLHVFDVANATAPGRYVRLRPANRKSNHGEPMCATDLQAYNTSAIPRNRLARPGETVIHRIPQKTPAMEDLGYFAIYGKL